MKTTEELKALRDSISQRSWANNRLIDSEGKAYATLYQAHIDCDVCMVWAPEGSTEQESNAQAIALVPDLLSEVIRLREALGTLRNGLFRDADAVNEYIDATIIPEPK
jgi:regulator of RNase E activity RraA